MIGHPPRSTLFPYTTLFRSLFRLLPPARRARFLFPLATLVVLARLPHPRFLLRSLAGCLRLPLARLALLLFIFSALALLGLARLAFGLFLRPPFVFLLAALFLLLLALALLGFARLALLFEPLPELLGFALRFFRFLADLGALGLELGVRRGFGLGFRFEGDADRGFAGLLRLRLRFGFHLVLGVGLRFLLGFGAQLHLGLGAHLRLDLGLDADALHLRFFLSFAARPRHVVFLVLAFGLGARLGGRVDRRRSGRRLGLGRRRGRNGDGEIQVGPRGAAAFRRRPRSGLRRRCGRLRGACRCRSGGDLANKAVLVELEDQLLELCVERLADPLRDRGHRKLAVEGREHRAVGPRQ